MNNTMDNLYRQVIMEHYKYPRNKGLKGFAKVHLHNPSCGDDITVEADIQHNVISEINHDGSGCSICCSSASVMSEVLAGKTKPEAMEIIYDFYNLVTGNEVQDVDRLDEAVVFEGVSNFPARTTCATISWNALEMILKGDIDE